MDILHDYLFDPMMKILEHDFELFGNTISLLDILIISIFSSIAGYALYRLFGE